MLLNMLEIRGLHKSFSSSGLNLGASEEPSSWVLKNVNLEVRQGEFMTWLGPSGCGKTTLLRCLAGLETPTRGDILLDGRSLNAQPPQERPFHMVFQRYALFPHMTVQENIEFPLKIRKVEAMALKSRVQALLEMMGLEAVRFQKPGTLSGGQAQRVALARALANQPRLLLLDEPLSALDEKIRYHLRQELRELQKRVGITFIFVTHDQQEAFQLSDRIAVFYQGRLHQVGSSQDIYSKPQTEFVAQFVGSKNRVASGGYLYPDQIQIGDQGPEKVQGQLVRLDFLGREYEALVQILGTQETWRVLVSASQSQNLTVSQKLTLSYDSRQMMRVNPG